MELEGILALYKPRGMTSFDCIFKTRKIIGIKKIGHTGTLDPEVDGVLPLCIGRATRVAEYLTDREKSYEGEITIGSATTTEDQTGDIVSEKKITRTFTRQEILDVLQSFVGEITQTPPMFSAVRVKGKRLYEYAREGLEVERPTRQVQIYSMELLDKRDTFTGEQITFSFRVACSKGTYIRTLAVMMGEKLGYPAHMSKLTRIQSATYTLADCVTLEEVAQLMVDGNLKEKLHPLETALTHLPKYIINDKITNKVKNGAVLDIPTELLPMDEPVVLETMDGLAIAIYMKHPEKEGLMKPQKVFRVNSL